MKTRIKMVLTVMSYVLGVSAFCISTGFAWYLDANTTPREISFKITNTNHNQFLQESELRNVLDINSAQWLHTPKNTMIKTFEHQLKLHAAVQVCNVYTTHSGKICIEALSKTPLMRVQEPNATSYYIDTQGKQMPLSDIWTARVPLVNGNVNAQRFNVTKTTKGFSYSAFCTTLFTDSLFKQLIHQVYIDSLGQLILTPIMGARYIIMDTSANYPNTLQQLRQFYISAISKSQYWNAYSSIDLRFANQIIAIPETPVLKTDTLKHHE